MNLPFSHLRVSSEFSITHGLLTIDQIVDKAKEYSTPSVALTDNLNMFGLVKFFNKCETAGIKPISGASINVIFDGDDMPYELLCLAKSNKGHRSLMKIISKAHNNYNFSSPIISFKDLCELKDDLIVISGGRSSHIFELVRNERVQDLDFKVESFMKNFGDDFVLEIQNT